ncbi:MAG: YicC family protein [Beggiatoa sp.]|nr:YicC family protein [Beggiatoa sp.]
MADSMTGYARESTSGAWGRATCELRSVNHRYLEVTLRLPEELRALEGPFRTAIGQYLQRGKVECTLRYEPAAEASGGATVRLDLVRQIIAACREVEELTGAPTPPSALDLLKWPGVMDLSSPDLTLLQGPLTALLEAALATLGEGRRREGERLAALIAGRCDSALVELARVREGVSAALAQLRERLLARAEELSASLDPGRLEQEMLLLAQRLDVAEELDRLGIHIDEVKRLLAARQPIGRRLDFLLQEMHREANTTASKSAHPDTSGAAIELKVLIEQMREQAQNIE